MKVNGLLDIRTLSMQMAYLILGHYVFKWLSTCYEDIMYINGLLDIRAVCV